MTRVYYNDADPYCCQWLKNLIAAGELPPGDVDCRSIIEVKPEEVAHYNQRHWFAGIGGWPLALKLAGWGDRPIDTGSCPCQPFSAAGKRRGTDDPRHLWPAFFRLIRARRPDCVFGEQVGGAGGREWLAGIFADLDGIGYRTGAVDLPAASVGAPHIRQRLYWVAHARSQRVRADRPSENGSPPGGMQGTDGQWQRVWADAGAVGGRLEQPTSHGRQQRRPEPGGRGAEPRRGAGGLADAERDGRRPDEPGRRSQGRETDGWPGPWDDAVLIPCADGRARRVGQRLQFVADGISDSMVVGQAREASQEGVNNGIPAQAGPDQALSGVRCADDAQANGQPTGGLGSLLSPTVLRPAVHGHGDGGRHQSNEPEGDTSPVGQNEHRAMRTLRPVGHPDDGSPQGQQRPQQRPLELADALRLMPSACALGAAQGDATTVQILYTLFPPSEAQWSVQHSLHALAKAWEPPTREAVERAWRAGLLDGFAMMPFWPLTAHEPSRVGALRGAGNAIVPQVAALFIRAYLETEAAM